MKSTQNERRSSANGRFYKLIYRRHISRLLSPEGRRAGVAEAFNLSLSADSYTTAARPPVPPAPPALRGELVERGPSICLLLADRPSIVSANVKSIARTSPAESGDVFVAPLIDEILLYSVG